MTIYCFCLFGSIYKYTVYHHYCYSWPEYQKVCRWKTVVSTDRAKAAEPPLPSRLLLGKTLTNLQTFASYLPPSIRGEVIGSSGEIRLAHNSYARRHAFLTNPEDRHMKVSCQS